MLPQQYIFSCLFEISMDFLLITAFQPFCSCMFNGKMTINHHLLSSGPLFLWDAPNILIFHVRTLIFPINENI